MTERQGEEALKYRLDAAERRIERLDAEHVQEVQLLKESEARVELLEEELEAERDEVRYLSEENGDLRDKVDALIGEVDDLRSEVAALEEELEAERSRVAELEDEVAEYEAGYV